jgi:hypothetical protein
MRVPPVQQAATVRMPATDGTQALEEVSGTRLIMPAVSTQCPNACDETDYK